MKCCIILVISHIRYKIRLDISNYCIYTYPYKCIPDDTNSPDESQYSENSHWFDEMLHTLVDHYTIDGFPSVIWDKGLA